MKNGKAPTREQKKIMKAHGLVPENWLVVTEPALVVMAVIALVELAWLAFSIAAAYLEKI